MATFDDFLQETEKGIIALAKTDWKSFADAAVSDGNAFVDKLKEDLENWTAELARGDISKKDFEWLVAGKKDLAELEGLKEVGLGKAVLDRFVNGLVAVVVNTAIKVFLA